jgi:hypothetical protein
MTPTNTAISVISIMLIFFLGVMYRVFEEFVYKYAFVIKNTINIKELAGVLRVGKFGIFIGLWALLLIFNMVIFAVAFRKYDFLNQMKLTSILFVGIVATTFVIIDLIPGLVEIFGNTFGSFVISSFATSWIFKYNKIMKVFKSKLFHNDANVVIPFDYLMPMFNVDTFEETFNNIADESKQFRSKKEVSNGNEGDEKKELFDFYFDYNEICTDEDENEDAAKNKFKNELFKLCFAKHNAGHFMWAYISSVVTMLSTVAVM